MADIIDVKEFLDRVQGDKELALELLDIYQEDFTGKKEALDKAVSDKDTIRIKEIAHSIKGASGNISAKAMYTNCQQIEMHAKNNELDRIVPILKDLDNQFAELKSYASKLKQDFPG